jgi:hypothetical protein
LVVDTRGDANLMSLAILLQVMSGISIQGKLILDGRLLIIPFTYLLYPLFSPHNAFIHFLIISHHTPNNKKPWERIFLIDREVGGVPFIYIYMQSTYNAKTRATYCTATHGNSTSPLFPSLESEGVVLNVKLHQKLPAPEKCRIFPPPISIPFHIFHSQLPISLSLLPHRKTQGRHVLVSQEFPSHPIPSHPISYVNIIMIYIPPHPSLPAHQINQ